MLVIVFIVSLNTFLFNQLRVILIVKLKGLVFSALIITLILVHAQLVDLLNFVEFNEGRIAKGV